MSELLQEAYLIFRISLVIGFLNFLFYGATWKSEQKYLIRFIGSLVILLVITGIMIVDKFIISSPILLKVYLHYVGSAFVFFVVGLVLFLVHFRTIKYKHKTKYKEPKKKMVYTYHEKREYLYYFFCYNDDLYLLDETLTGIKYHLKKSEFSDEVLRNQLDKMNLDLFDAPRRKGTVIVKGDKVDDAYYCYMIELNSPLDNYNYARISKTDFVSRDVNRIDKYIIIKCLASDHFDDTL